MSDTLTPGRVDIVIFANGGWEFIGRINADPDIPENEYLPEVLDFVGKHQNLSAPEKFTGYYQIKGDKLIMNWRDYAGEIERMMPEAEIIDPAMFIAPEMPPFMDAEVINNA